MDLYSSSDFHTHIGERASTNFQHWPEWDFNYWLLKVAQNSFQHLQ